MDEVGRSGYFGKGSSSRSTRSRSSRTRRKERAEGSAWHWFKHDLKAMREGHVKRTSTAHKRFVIALVLIGAVLRAWLLAEPVTVGEASAYMAFGTQSVLGIITDYSLPSNHVLHTLLMKLSTNIFGLSTWSMRLPAFLAGVLALPLFYVLVRSLFNRYIALMALAMCAASPQLIELSTLALGYSMVWVAMLTALLLGRHLVRENNIWSAVFLGLALALGMWSVPSMIFCAITVYLWALFTVLGKYQRSLSERSAMLGLSVVVFILATLLLYLPVVLEHGVDMLFHHVSEGERTWAAFRGTYAEHVIDFWIWMAEPTYGWVLFLGFGALFHASYISGKFRALAFATLLGAVPLATGLMDAGKLWQWSYVVFFFNLGSAIGLFYLLKLVQERVFKTLGKRTRTGWAAVVLVALFASGLDVAVRRMAHQGESRLSADLLGQVLRPDDRLCFDVRIESIIGFELLAQGMERARLQALLSPVSPMPSGSTLWLGVGRRSGPSAAEALGRCGHSADGFSAPVSYKHWERFEIFAARKR